MRSLVSSRTGSICLLLVIGMLVTTCTQSTAAPLRPVSLLSEWDAPWDGGEAISIQFRSSPDDPGPQGKEQAFEYRILRSFEAGGEFHEVAKVKAVAASTMKFANIHVYLSEQELSRLDEVWLGSAVIGNCHRGKPHWFRVVAVNVDGEQSAFEELPLDLPIVPTRQWFDARRMWLAIIMTAICGAVVGYVIAARMGVKLIIRKIAGLDAIEDAVGRATEMGKACLFVPGVQDINDIQTIAGLTILGRVAEKAAEYDCELDVPTSRSLVMTAARETVAAAFYAAGRPDAFNEDRIYYVTDEQFAYVSHLTGIMVREKPAACFYLGSFFAESLILAETGNAVGAIQIAGTAQPAQLPFFVAACDYTLIGEEFFAASAYLSGDPDQLGSLKGQDVGKVIVTVLVMIGVMLSTMANVCPGNWEPGLRSAESYLLDTILGEG